MESLSLDIKRPILEKVLFRELGTSSFGMAVDAHFALAARADWKSRSPSLSPASARLSKSPSPWGAATGGRGQESGDGTELEGTLGPEVDDAGPCTPSSRASGARSPRSEWAASHLAQSIKSHLSDRSGSSPQPSHASPTATSSVGSDLSTIAKNMLSPRCDRGPDYLLPPKPDPAYDNPKPLDDDMLDETSGRLFDQWNGFEVWYSYVIKAQLRREHLLQNPGKLGDIVSGSDECANVEAMARTHYEVRGLHDGLVSSGIISSYAASGKCSRNFARLMTKTERELQTTIYGIMYMWFIGVAACEMVEGETDDDEMEVAFDVLDEFTWRSFTEIMEDELASSAMGPGTAIVTEFRYLVGLLDVKDEDPFTAYPFDTVLPHGRNAHMPEMNRYRFADRPWSDNYGPDNIYKLLYFLDI